MSSGKKDCQAVQKGVHFENYSLIIVTDTFPIYKMLCLEMKNALCCWADGRNVLFGPYFLIR
jgi:hypothetical protein